MSQAAAAILAAAAALGAGLLVTPRVRALAQQMGESTLFAKNDR